MLFDTHCHLDFPAYDRDREQVFARALAAGVGTVLVPGVDRPRWDRLHELPTGPLALRFALAIHPQIVDDEGPAETQRALDALGDALDRIGAVAVGELGWDKKQSPATLARQTEVVDAQIEIAKARDLPILVHAVDAHGLALERLARHAPLRGVMHSYSGSADLVREYVKLGLAISIGPSITLPNARRPIEAARAVPRDRLLIETDGPFQFPAGPDRKERRGEPADLVRVLAELSAIRNEDRDELAHATTANARALLGDA